MLLLYSSCWCSSLGSNGLRRIWKNKFLVNVERIISHCGPPSGHPDLSTLLEWHTCSHSGGHQTKLRGFTCLALSVFQGKVAQTACMSACKHISTSLMQLLLDPEVRQISMGALHQLHIDIKECEGESWTPLIQIHLIRPYTINTQNQIKFHKPSESEMWDNHHKLLRRLPQDGCNIPQEL